MIQIPEYGKEREAGEKMPETIGTVEVDEEGMITALQRGASWQGMCFKDWQSPTSLFAEEMKYGFIIRCEQDGKLTLSE